MNKIAIFAAINIGLLSLSGCITTEEVEAMSCSELFYEQDRLVDIELEAEEDAAIDGLIGDLLDDDDLETSSGISSLEAAGARDDIRFIRKEISRRGC